MADKNNPWEVQSETPASDWQVSGMKPMAMPVGPAPMPQRQIPTALGGNAKGLSQGVDTDFINRFVTGSAVSAADAAPGVAKSLLIPGGQMYAQGKQAIQNTMDAFGGQQKPLAEGVGSQLGINVDRIKEAAKANDYAGVAAEATVPVGLALLGGKLGRKVPDPVQGTLGDAVQVPKPVAVAKIAQAIEPDPKIASTVRENLNTHLDAIKVAAEQNKIPLNSVENLANATKAAAVADPYRKSFIEPFKDTEVSLWKNPVRGYKGATANEGGTTTATIGQLDARLSQINDTLYPKYQKGGAGSNAAQAAIGAENVAQLNSEAAGIRRVIAEEVGKLTGVPAEEVGAARARYGQLRDLAEKLKFRVEDMRNAEIEKANTPTRVKDLNPKNIPINPKNWFGNIPDRVIEDTFNAYKPTK